MNEPVTKQRPQIDMDEFERFIRETASKPVRPGEDDPLAELARLVGHDPDPYNDVFAHQDEMRHPSFGQDPAYDHGQVHPRPGVHPQTDGADLQRRGSVDFAAIEAGLRGTMPAHQPVAPYADDTQAYYEQHGATPPAGDNYDWQQAPASPPAPRSRRPVYAMAAVIVACIAGIGVAFSYKGSNSGPREIAMIKAAPGPTKIQPPADEASDQSARDASILDKAQQPAPSKTIAREEQPVDLAQTIQNSPRDVGNGITPIYNFGNSDGNASRIPVPVSPNQAQSGQRPSEALGLASDIQPIRVKTRSYRPDGTPIPNDQPPASVMDAMPPTMPAAKTDKPVVAKASTPKVTTPKSTTRVAAPKPTMTADHVEGAPTDLTPAATTAHKVKPVKPIKMAKIDATDNAEPAATATKAEATETTADSGTGGFAVQLAAPGSEAEAKQASSRLSQKYASELGGRHLGFHKAVANGKSVFRVRVGSLTREEATDMCEKLKSSGGSCFVAKN